MPDYTFRKGERLSRKKAITSLFKSGRVQVSSPVRILYQQVEGEEYPAKMAVSVPKRLFKRAVDRNLLKRRVREIYRHFKPFLYDQLNQAGIQIHLVIQYQRADIVTFEMIEKGIQQGLNKVMAELTG
jgi:ribonuclease P protein component